MHVDELLAHLDAFLKLLSDTRIANEEERIRELSSCLDDIISAGKFFPEMPEAVMDREPHGIPSQIHFTQLSFQRFSSLGSYNVPLEITRNIGSTALGIMDAHDDIASIAHAIAEILWYATYASKQTAVWYYVFGMENDLGHHLHHLRWYLFARKYEG